VARAALSYVEMTTGSGDKGFELTQMQFKTNPAAQKLARAVLVRSRQSAERRRPAQSALIIAIGREAAISPLRTQHDERLALAAARDTDCVLSTLVAHH
jgi:hypothetical protein